ncbi:MAG: NAD-dependent epimerase/dehydratase family protein [Opitutales bacterium]
MNKKFIVTGGGGFVGRAVIAQLLETYPECQVVSLSRSVYEDLNEKDRVSSISCDLSGPLEPIEEAFYGTHAVFHIAAKAGVWGPEEEYFKANVVASRNVVVACRKANVPYLVYTSTPSVVFSGEPFRGEGESLPYGRNWLCSYAESKATAEKETLGANEPGRLAVCALRPHLIWGPGDPHIVPRLVDRAQSGRLRIVGDGANKVDISYIDNVAAAHLNALSALQQGKAGGKPYFISQGEPVNLWDWINGLFECLDMPPLRKKISLTAAYKIGSICEFIWRKLKLSGEPPMTRFVATELGKDHYFDISAAQRDLGYIPKVSTEEGLKRTVAWFKNK